MATKAKAKATVGYTRVEWRPGVKMYACQTCGEIIEDRGAMKAHVEAHVRKR